VIIFAAVLAGYLVYAVVAFIVAAIVWMFTTVFGLVLVTLFVVGVTINFLAPEEGDGDYDDMDGW
jgi:type IV secretory pathway VirB2 component (pilin)